jgi:hypothetical protein
MSTFFILAVALFSPAPASQPSATPAVKAPKAANMMGAEKLIHRGAAFALTESISIDAVAKDPKAFDGKTVQVTGTVNGVCVKKGCWMTIAGENPATRARVTFKDYGFFVPLDSTASKGKIEGVVSLKTMTQAERAHLAQDGGKKIEEIPEHELRVVASAVELRRL